MRMHTWMRTRVHGSALALRFKMCVLDLPPAEAPELLTYAQLYGGASGFNVYGFEAESSDLCWDSDSSGGAPPAS